MSLITYPIAFLLMLTPIVFLHELGHFLFAKLFNVKVKTFSIFMGKKLFSRTWGETEYCISAIPIGGYVSLVGEDPTQELPPEEEKRALHSQAYYKKFLIIAAGPTFNFITAFLLYTFITAVGEPTVSNRIARVVKNSPAAVAGLTENDVITHINDTPIKHFPDYAKALTPLKDQLVTVTIKREDEVKKLQVQTSSEPSFDQFGKDITRGSINGIDFRPLSTMIGISDSKSLAAKLGMKTGDKITSINKKPITLFMELKKEIKKSIQNQASSITLTISRNDAMVPFTIKLTPNIKETLVSNFFDPSVLGIENASMFVKQLEKGYPAEQSGIHAKDKLVAINGKTVYSFQDFYLEVQKIKNTKQSIPIKVKRDGTILSFHVSRKETVKKDTLGNKETHFYIGVSNYPAYERPFQTIIRTEGFFNIVSQGFERTVTLSTVMIKGILKLFTGDIPFNKISGPIVMGKFAGVTLSLGLIVFLNYIALISLNLAFINLVPFPALDGGHIVIMTVEAIIRRKIPAKVISNISVAGFFFLISFMMIIAFNDLRKLFF